MFGREKSRGDVDVLPPPRPTAAPPEATRASSVESVLAPSMSIKGNVDFEGALRVDGEVHGNITGQGRLTISAEGRIVGDIMAAVVVIQGKVQGNVTAVERLEIAGSAQVVGDVRAPSLGVADGARILGRLDINSESITPLSSNGHGREPAPAAASPDALDKVL